jgi:NTP pyrophosphatase (non-canonical NTP hydrolase)
MYNQHMNLQAKLDKLNNESTLRDLQSYVQDMVVARGFDRDEDVAKKMLLLTEEVGELAQALRKQSGLAVDISSDYHGDVAGEMADVLIILLGLANMCGIDLVEAFLTKEAINQKRTWSK